MTLIPYAPVKELVYSGEYDCPDIFLKHSQIRLRFLNGIIALLVGDRGLPEIARFHGIIIRMYHSDRHHPHFHAYFGEHSAIYTIDPPALYTGTMPRMQQHLILAWTEVHQDELVENWRLARQGRFLHKIRGTI